MLRLVFAQAVRQGKYRGMQIFLRFCSCSTYAKFFLKIPVFSVKLALQSGLVMLYLLWLLSLASEKATKVEPLSNTELGDYSRTSVARTLMARLPRLFRTRS